MRDRPPARRPKAAFSFVAANLLVETFRAVQAIQLYNPTKAPTMLAPATALRVNQLIFTLFSIGMMFFPAEMMQGYSELP